MVRRLVWQSLYEFTSGFEDRLPPGPPSLEYLALLKYDPEFSTAEIDQDELSACGEILEPESDHPEWRMPALAA